MTSPEDQQRTSLRVWSRRAVLAVGLAALVPGRASAATGVRVGDLSMIIPPSVSQVDDPELGAGWQWQGVAGRPEQPSMIILARADLPSIDAREVLAALLSTGIAGGVPVAHTPPEPRSMPGGKQVRTVLTLAGRRPYRGAMLITTRDEPPAGAVVVLGDDSLTAQSIDAVLESVQWVG